MVQTERLRFTAPATSKHNGQGFSRDLRTACFADRSRLAVRCKQEIGRATDTRSESIALPVRPQY